MTKIELINDNTTLLSHIDVEARDIIIRFGGKLIFEADNVDIKIQEVRDKNTNNWKPVLHIEMNVREGEPLSWRVE